MQTSDWLKYSANQCRCQLFLNSIKCGYGGP